jgi:hypothetical protein
MNFGYLIFVSKHETIDYYKLAYGLALSIKNTQKPGYDKVALVVDDIEEIKKFNSPWVFDEIIQWDRETFWDGRSWMDKLSPWDYTVCLDSDMLFLRDYSHWVDFFIENCELYVANKSYNYRGDIVTNDFYRRAFTINELPNLYSFYTFFKKGSELADSFFTLGRYIIKNPDQFKNTFFPGYKPNVVGTDEAFALSAKILDIEDTIAFDLDFPKVVHMKPMVQGWPWPADVTSDHVGFYINRNGQMKIGNFQQTDIVHYVEKEIVNDEIINILEEIAWKK